MNTFVAIARRIADAVVLLFFAALYMRWRHLLGGSPLKRGPTTQTTVISRKVIFLLYYYFNGDGYYIYCTTTFSTSCTSSHLGRLRLSG